MQLPLATRSQRFAATIINLVVGAFPLSIPNIVYSYGAGWGWGSWVKNETALALLSATLCLVQLLLVHRMQGSPGAVFAGLRIQQLDGSPANLRKTLIRGAPFALVVAICISINLSRENQVLIGSLALILFVLLLFIFASGLVVLLGSKRSLIDRLSRIDLVKAY